jgi:hypothetical protein
MYLTLISGYEINIVFADILYCTRQALGPTQPPIQCVPGALSLEVKQPGA